MAAHAVLEAMWLVILAVLALGACTGEPAATRVGDTTRAACAAGERPRYFVPAPPGAPVALLGCARLGISGKRVEFSGSADGGGGACVNPAYSGRGQRGLFIPGICRLEPPLSRFAVRDAGQPRQGVRGYGYVIWGTAGDAKEVVARFRGSRGQARAAAFSVGARLARRFGERPFRLFVVELPEAAACGPVTLAASRAAVAERVPPQARLCKRARGRR